MANEIRVRGAFTSGTLSGALTNVATSMSSAGLANLPVVGATQHAVIAIENEIVYVTAHTGGATTATILRGQEGTTAAPHNSAVAWYHGPVVSDFDSVLGYAQVTANQGTFTAATDLTGLSVIVTVPYAGHRVRISGSLLIGSSVADDVAQVTIQEGATVLQTRNNLCRPVNVGQGFPNLEAVIVPTAASHTYKVTAARSAGTGNLTMFAAATFPAFILVEDLGPAL
jgi:hypothetical protein